MVHLAVLVGHGDPDDDRPDLDDEPIPYQLTGDLGRARRARPLPPLGRRARCCAGAGARPGGRADRRGRRPSPAVPGAGHHRVRGPPAARSRPARHPRRPCRRPARRPRAERSVVVNLPALVLLAVFTLGARLAWRRGARLIALGCLAAAGLFAVSVWRTTHPAVLAVLALAVLGLVWHRWARHLGDGDPLGLDRSAASPAWRPALDIARHRGGMAMRRRAATVRPSLRAAGRRARLRAAARGCRSPRSRSQLCRVGFTAVWASIEESCWCSAARAPARPSGSPGGSSTPPARCSSPPPAPTCST